MATQSTAEALALLRATRKHLIEVGTQIAIEICMRNGGTFHSQEMITLMEKRGLLDDARRMGIRDYWTGAVCKKDIFEYTGHMEKPPKPKGRTTNIHDWKPIMVWRLKGYKKGKGGGNGQGELF